MLSAWNTAKTYHKYRNARDIAWAFLIENRITKFPIKISQLVTQHGIRLIKQERAIEIFPEISVSDDFTAAAFELYDDRYIAYDPNVNSGRLRFTIAHELGHFELGHVHGTPKVYNSYEENEANIFARDLLMPAIVCHIERIQTPEQIMDFFGVSRQAAQIRAERIIELEGRGKWLTSPLEREYAGIYRSDK